MAQEDSKTKTRIYWEWESSFDESLYEIQKTACVNP